MIRSLARFTELGTFLALIRYFIEERSHLTLAHFFDRVKNRFFIASDTLSFLVQIRSTIALSTCRFVQTL